MKAAPAGSAGFTGPIFLKVPEERQTQWQPPAGEILSATKDATSDNSIYRYLISSALSESPSDAP
jgi:hypothetical protein